MTPESKEKEMKENDIPAFPGFEYYIHEPTLKIVTGFPFGGISLRDYFAGQAMMGMCANPDETAPTYSGSRHDIICKTAYDLADAMLEERVK